MQKSILLCALNGNLQRTAVQKSTMCFWFLRHFRIHACLDDLKCQRDWMSFERGWVGCWCYTLLPNSERRGSQRWKCMGLRAGLKGTWIRLFRGEIARHFKRQFLEEEAREQKGTTEGVIKPGLFYQTSWVQVFCLFLVAIPFLEIKFLKSCMSSGGTAGAAILLSAPSGIGCLSVEVPQWGILWCAELAILEVE